MNPEQSWLRKPALIGRRKFLAKLSISSSLVFCQPTFSDAINWHKSAKNVLSRDEFSALKIVIQKFAIAGNFAPLSIRFDGNQCVLEINDLSTNKTAALVTRIRAEHRNAFIESLVVREVAHCWRRQDNPERSNRILAIGDVVATRPQFIPWYQKAVQEEGMFADIAALSWLENVYPNSYSYLLAVFILWREEQVMSGNLEVDLSGLYRTRQFGMIYGETPFYAADTTLAMVRKRFIYQNQK